MSETKWTDEQQQAIDDTPLRAQGSEPGVLVVDRGHVLIPEFFIAHRIYLARRVVATRYWSFLIDKD